MIKLVGLKIYIILSVYSNKFPIFLLRCLINLNMANIYKKKRTSKLEDDKKLVISLRNISTDRFMECMLMLIIILSTAWKTSCIFINNIGNVWCNRLQSRFKVKYIISDTF